MAYITGDRIVYNGNEICSIDGIVKKCFDGVHEQDYYKLVPVGTPSASYYIPSDKLEERVRPLLTRDEILQIIDSMPDAEPCWSDDKNERKNLFGQTLKSRDYTQLLGMMKAIYNEKQRRVLEGKSLVSSDEKALISAEKLLHTEFSIVLGIPEDKVDEFIEKRLA